MNGSAEVVERAQPDDKAISCCVRHDTPWRRPREDQKRKINSSNGYFAHHRPLMATEDTVYNLSYVALSWPNSALSSDVVNMPPVPKITRFLLSESLWMIYSYTPMYHSSTPMTSNFLPSSLRGSLPNVGHVSETPFSRLSSSHRP